MNEIFVLINRIFYKNPKNLFFYLLAFIIYILLLIVIIFLVIKKSFFVFLFFYIILTFSFLILGMEAGIIVAGLWVILNIIGTFFANGIQQILINCINIVLTGIFSYLLGMYIYEVDTRKQKNDLQLIDIQRQIIEKKEEFDKVKALIEANKIRIKNYTVLNEVAQKLASTLEKEEIFKIVAGSSSQLLGGKEVKFNLLVWDEDSGIYENIGEEKNIKPSNSTSINLYKKDPFDEWVEVNKHTLFVKNIDDDYRFKILRKELFNFKSLISIPLLIKQKMIGILKFHSPKSNFFDNDDARILNYLGDLCTAAVQNSLLYLKTKELAIKDGLTGLYMRRYFIEKLDEEIKRVKQLSTTFSFLMVDIDHFKECNDTYGHLFGDKVLRILGEFLKDNLRDVDIIGRYGGEEFAIILPNTNLNGANFVAERLRSNFEKLVIKVNENEGRKVTLSIGGVEYKKDMKLMEVINCADKALYHSKETGRNKVTFWEDIE